MTNKRPRNLIDEIAAKKINRIVDRSGLNNSAIDRASHSQIGYNRVRDLRLGLKAPVRLSEFLLICDVCHADPVATLRDIIREAKRIQAEQDARERAQTAAGDPLDIDAWADRIKTEDGVHSK